MAKNAVLHFFLSFPNCLSVGFFFSFTSDVSREVNFHQGKSCVKSLGVALLGFF